MEKYIGQGGEYYSYKIPHDFLDQNFIDWLVQLKIDYSILIGEFRVHNGYDYTYSGRPGDRIVYRIRDKFTYIVSNEFFSKRFFDEPIKLTIDHSQFYTDADKLEELAIEFMESEGISINENYRYAFTLSYPDVTMLMARFVMHLKEKENEIS